MKRQTFLEYSKVILISLAILFTTALFSFVEYVFTNNGEGREVSKSNILPTQKITVVIDAGHGGIDSGAVGISGTLEKDVNLEISMELSSILNLTNIDFVMTRTTDTLLYKEGQEDRKKFYDLRNRCEIAESIENPLFISIHQNKFPLEKYKGLQVYYSKNNDKSQAFAKNLQQKTATFLQKDNNRSIKPAGRNIYILKNLQCPAVLVECGFLSNSQEEQLLSDSEYRKKIAFLIFSAICDHIYPQELIKK